MATSIAVSGSATPVPAPPKISRYRSLRGKSVSESRKKVDDILKEKDSDSSSIRSAFSIRSSKRRSKSLGGLFAFPAVPPVPPVPTSEKTSIINRPRTPTMKSEIGKAKLQEQDFESIEAPRSAPPVPIATAMSVDTAVPADTVAVAETTESPTEYFDPETARREAEEQSWKEQEDRKRNAEEEEAARWADEVARLEAETDRILLEQKKKDLARIHNQLLTSSSSTSLPLKSPKSPIAEKFSFLTRGRRSQAATLSPTSSTTVSIDFTRTQSLEPNLPPRSYVEGGSHMMTPPHSPLSTSAGNDNLVTVRCREVCLSLNVEFETSTVDILFQASDAMKNPINTANSIVFEHYAQLGLERRLRRYERIIEVMDSWDSSTKNSLYIQPHPGTVDGDKDLDISSVPPGDGPARGFCLQLQHSLRPGKWSKRYVTLLSDGHMYSHKKSSDPAPRPSPTGGYISKGDTISLCHLRDADIYSPTEEQSKKVLKPPKKYVYAIKSQQRTTAFANSGFDAQQNFVHFFCTDDASTAQQFQSLVHGWRSWYIVKQRREEVARVQARKAKGLDKPPQIGSIKHKPKKSISHVKVNGHKVKVSIDEAPYNIGEFQPLINLERFDKPIDEFGKDWIPDATQRKSIQPPVVETPPPTPSLAKTHANAAERQDSKDDVKEDKAAEGAGPEAEATSPTEEKSPAAEENSELETPRPATSIKVEEPIYAEPIPEPEPPKPEPTSWFPSASAHSAKKKEEEEKVAPRPSTSHGGSYFSQDHHRGANDRAFAQNRGDFSSLHEEGVRRQQSRRAPKPQPLTLKGPNGGGNAYLAELISAPSTPTGGSHFLQVPPRSATVRRDPNAGGLSSPRLMTRPSTSHGESRPGMSGMRSRSHTNLREINHISAMANNAPPMPRHDQQQQHPQQSSGGGRRPPEDPLPPLPPMPLNMRSAHGASQSLHQNHPDQRQGGHSPRPGGPSGGGRGGNSHVDYSDFPPVPSSRSGGDRIERGRDPRPRDMVPPPMPRGMMGEQRPPMSRSMTARI